MECNFLKLLIGVQVWAELERLQLQRGGLFCYKCVYFGFLVYKKTKILREDMDWKTTFTFRQCPNHEFFIRNSNSANEI